MTVRKKSGPVAELQISHAFGSTLFERLHVSKLKLLLEQLFPEKRIEQRGAGTILMNCVSPSHPDHRPSLYIHANLNYAVCKSCGFRTRNLLDFLNISLGFSSAESLIKIHEITGTRLVNDKVAKQLDALDIHQQATRYFGEICNQYLVALVTHVLQKAPVPVSRAPYFTDALFHSVKPVLEWLFEQRKLTPELCAYLPYGVMPPSDLFKYLARELLSEIQTQLLTRGTLPSGFSVERFDAVLEKMTGFHKEVPVEHMHSVVFIMGYSPSVVGRLRCRRVTRGTGTDNNFWNMPGFTAQDPMGYLGMFLPNTNGIHRVEAERTRVIMVESEISMLRIQEHLIQNSIPDTIVVASAGSNNETDLIHQAGFSNVDLLLDHPDSSGEEQLKIKLQTALHTEARVFNAWGELRGNLPAIKDPDDVLTNHSWEHFKKYVFDEQDRAFLQSDLWASDRAIEEASVVPAAKILERQAKVVEFGKCVCHPALLAAFVTRVADALGLPHGPLRAAIVQLKDDEAGFIARLVEMIKCDFVVLYKDDTQRVGTLVLFHREQRRHIVVNVTDGANIVAVLANIYGEMYTHIAEHVGLPGKQDGEELVPSKVAIRDGQKYIADYLKIAFQALYQGVLTLDECEQLGLGVHPQEHPDDPDLTIVRIHNGDRWFRVLIDNKTNTLKATELEGPIDGKYLFLPGRKRWSEALTSVEAIQESNQITVSRLREIFMKWSDLIDKAWKFKHQQEDVAFVAAMIFVLAAGDAFTSKIIFRVVGESNSGKSTLLSLLTLGQVPQICMVEQSTYKTGYTNASLYLQHNRSTLAMILEEASQDSAVNTHKTKQLEDINEMLRQVIFERGAVIQRYGQNGKLAEYFIRAHVAMTAVHEPRDVQDANRSYIVETVREYSRRDPAVTILNQLSISEIAQMRREVQLGILRFLPTLTQTQKEIYKTLNEKQLASFQADTRFLQNFGPIGAVFKTLGLDWVPLITQMIESRKERLQSQASNTASSLVYDKLLRAPIVPIPGSRNAFLSIMQCATMPSGYEVLNAAGIGVIVNPNNWTLIVDFVAAMSPGGAFYRMNDLNKNTPHQLKALLDHHPSVARPHRYKELGVMEALAANNMSALEYEISVISIAKLREQVLQRAASYTGVPLTSTKSDQDQKPFKAEPDANNI